MAELDLGRVVGKNGLHAYANMLDNAYFLNPVNQRVGTSYTAQGYTIDRWRAAADTTVNITNEGLTVTGEVFQPFLKERLTGETLTAAVMLSNGTLICESGVVPDGEEWNNFIIAESNGAEVRVSNATDGTLRFRLLPGGNTIKWAALYRGAYTKDTLPDFTPKGYAAELLACQRYYIRIKAFHVAGQLLTTGGRFGFTLPTAMRITPTLTLLEKGTIICNGVKDVAVTNATFVGATGNRIKISTEHASQSGWSLQTGTWLDGFFELSADL